MPPSSPAVAKTEGIATVGVVLHLADVKDDAELTVELKSKEQGKAAVPLKDVLAGKHVPILGGSGVVRLISTATPVAVAKTEDDFPAACYGPDGTLWVAYVAYTSATRPAASRQKPYLKEQPKNFKALYTPEFADQVLVKYNRGGKWSEPIAVTDAKQDIVRVPIAVDKEGQMLGGVQRQPSGGPRCLCAAGQPRRRQVLRQRVRRRSSTAEGPFLAPSLSTDAEGRVHMACQALG